MIEIKNKVDCCGCNACGDACAHGAITFKTDIEGFWYPEVDKAKCVDCGLCEKVCPIINKMEFKKEGYNNPECYAVVNKNIETRFDSTSGGAFTAFAEDIYKQGGFVGGAIYDEDWSVRQFLSSTKSDLPKLRSSKYLQSHLDGFYISVKKALSTGKPVLVCGSPCQMAAMRLFLRRPYDNLYVVDYICRGIASPLYFKKWIEYLEEKHNSKVVFYKAKSKELGWRQLSTRIEYANRDVDIIAGKDNPWLQMQYKISEIVRPSCFECTFKGFPRTSDLTIGDLWTTNNKISNDLDNDLGTSVVFVNSEKGKDLFLRCKNRIKYEAFPADEAIRGNYHLLNPIKKTGYNREELFSTLNVSFNATIQRYYPEFTKKNISIKDKIKNSVRFINEIRLASGVNIATLCKNLYYNLCCKQVKTNILEGRYIVIHKHCVINIHPKGQLILHAPLHFGTKKFKKSNLESRLLIEDGGRLSIGPKPYFISYGADIEVFKNALLEIEGGIGANIGLTIVCGNKISIGRDTGCGRNVTIRDNNGGHAISIRGYKNSLPVTIKNHVWLTESCTVMPGSVIEAGAIISARSVVSGHIPGSCIVSGDPAQVVEKNIYWKS